MSINTNYGNTLTIPPDFVGTIIIRGNQADMEGEEGIDSYGSDELPSWLLDKHATDKRQSARAKDSGATNTMADFMLDKGIKGMTQSEMKQLADTGQCNGPDGKPIVVDDNVREAAKRMTEGDNKLFNRMESAVTGENDKYFTPGDRDAAVKDGKIDAPGHKCEKRGFSEDDFFASLVNGKLNHSVPSEFRAARDLSDFAQDHNTGPLSKEDIKEMARTGYFTDDAGKKHRLSDKEIAAAEKFAENDFALYNKLADEGDEDESEEFTLPSRYENRPSDRFDTSGRQAFKAGEGIAQFQEDIGQGALNKQQMADIADHGYFKNDKGEKVYAPKDVQRDAQMLMANGGELFDKLESATTNKHDGILVPNDFRNAVKEGLVDENDRSGEYSPRETTSRRHVHYEGEDTGLSDRRDNRAGRLMADFQDQTGEGSLTKDQVADIAKKGYFVNADNEKVYAPDNVVEAAQRMSKNGGALFDRLESATDGVKDGKLGSNNYHDAVAKDLFSTGEEESPVRSRRTTTYEIIREEVPAAERRDFNAARSVSEFQDEAGIGLMDKDKLREMVRTGKTTNDKGEEVDVPSDVRAAGARMLQNDGKLFDLVEAAVTNKHDGKISAQDFRTADQEGSIGVGSGSAGDSPTRVRATTRFEEIEEIESESSSDYKDNKAASTIARFQEDSGHGALDNEQMQSIADNGYFMENGKKVFVPEDVQAAAKRMMDDNGELFAKVESATTGEHDGILVPNDYKSAVKNGDVDPDAELDETPTYRRVVTETVEEYGTEDEEISPRAGKNAARSVAEFQREIGNEPLNKQQLEDIAETGQFTKANGEVVDAPADVQAAAGRLLANDARLFNKVESATTGEHDKILMAHDFDKALSDGALN